MKNPYILSVLSGILCVLTFPPFDLSFLVWIALVPFLYAVLSSRRKERFGISESQLSGIIFGLVFYFGTLHWLFNIFGVFAVALILILCLYPFLFAYSLDYLNRRLRSPWVVLLFPSVLWTAVEFMKSEGWWLKFSWMGLGYTQSSFLPVLQVSSLIGQYGITALIVLANSFFASLFFLRKKHLVIAGSIMAVLAVSVLSYGFVRLSHGWETPIRIALVQSESSELDDHRSLIGRIQGADFILLPEYALPVYLEEDPYVLDAVKNLSEGRYLIVGSKERKDSGYYNTAFLFGPAGDILGRYHKMNPIQFFDDGYPGKEFSVFSTDHGKIGILICYDMDYSYVARNLVRNGAGLLLIPTFDAMRWGGLQHLEHSAMTSMRAVENGRFIARAASSGISQIIDPNGRITAEIPIGVSDIHTGTVAFVDGRTFYSGYGYILPYLAVFFSFGVILFSIIREKV